MNQLDNFKNWLIANGAEILRGTSEYEILRFKTDRPGVSLVYQFFREKPGLSGRGGIAAHPQGCGFFAMDFHRLTKFTENTIICK